MRNLRRSAVLVAVVIGVILSTLTPAAAHTVIAKQYVWKTLVECTWVRGEVGHGLTQDGLKPYYRRYNLVAAKWYDHDNVVQCGAKNYVDPAG